MIVKNNKNKRWWNTIPFPVIVGGLLLLITIIAALLRFYEIDKLSFWQDELFETGFIKVNLKDLVPIILQKDINMLSYDIIVNFWAKLVPSISEGSLRSLSALFSIASIPVVFLLGKSLSIDKKKATAVGLVAAFLVTINAYNIQYAQEFRAYSLVFLLTALSTFLFIKAVEKNSPIWWIGYSVISAIAIYSHLFAAFILIAQATSLLFLLRKNIHKVPFKGIIASFATIFILTIPLIFAAHSQGSAQIAWIQTPTPEAIEAFLTEITGNQGGLLVALYIYTAIAGVIIEAIRVNKQGEVFSKWKLVLIACSLILPVVLTLLISFIKPIFVDRYLLFIMPYLAIFAAYGIVSFVDLDKWKSRNFIGVVLLLIFILLSVIGIKNYFSTYQKEDYRGVAKFMSHNCLNSLILYYPEWVSVREYVPYYNNKLQSQFPSWYGLLYGNSTPDNIAKHLPSSYSKACLMLGYLFPKTTQEEAQISLIQTALKIRYPKESKVKFYELEVDTYQP